MIDARPPEGAAVRHGEATQRRLTLPPYGLEAYAALALPQRALRFLLLGEEPEARPEPGEVLVRLIPRTE